VLFSKSGLVFAAWGECRGNGMPRHRMDTGKVVMATFIGLVIIAGLFGPYMISFVLAGLSLACAFALA